MDWDVTEIRLEGEHSLWVRFRDGVEGIVRFMPSAFIGIFAHLKGEAEFNRVDVIDGVVTWPGELDLAPDAMHGEIKRNGQWTLA